MSAPLRCFLIAVSACTVFVAFAAGQWRYETARDALGQTVHVASIAPDAARPYIALRFLCGGIGGVVFQFNTGDMQLAGLASEPIFEGVRFEFADLSHQATATRAAIADGIGTFEIKGSEAFRLASLMQRGGSVLVSRGRFRLAFPLDGAIDAIGRVLEACPYKF
jgi:hypothetical protein